jgi:hypothetical protein
MKTNNNSSIFILGALTGAIFTFFLITLYSSHTYGRISEHKTCNRNVHQQQQEYAQARYAPYFQNMEVTRN